MPKIFGSILDVLVKRIDASLERERLFREDFSGRLMEQSRHHIDEYLEQAIAHRIDASLERERLFREDFSGRLMEQSRRHLDERLEQAITQRIDASFERERMFREDFSGRLVEEMRHYIDEHLTRSFAQRLPLIMSPGARIYTHTLDGHRVFLDPSEPFITFHVLEHGEWERPVRQVLRALLSPGQCYVDVGANIGLHALFAAMLVGHAGQVLLVEPHPKTVELLRDNLEINGLEGRVIVVEAAAAESDGGVRRFEYFPEHSAMSGFALVAERVKAFRGSAEPVDVPIVTLDALLTRYDLVPDVVKIDVEGFEMQVLAGSRGLLASGADTAFIIEHEPRLASATLGPQAAQTVLDYFLDNGFAGYLIVEGGCKSLSDAALSTAAGDLLFLRDNSARLGNLAILS